MILHDQRHHIRVRSPSQTRKDGPNFPRSPVLFLHRRRHVISAVSWSHRLQHKPALSACRGSCNESQWETSGSERPQGRTDPGVGDAFPIDTRISAAMLRSAIASSWVHMSTRAPREQSEPSFVWDIGQGTAEAASSCGSREGNGGC